MTFLLDELFVEEEEEVEVGRNKHNLNQTKKS